MLKRTIFTFIISLFSAVMLADAIDDLQTLLHDHPQVQEKVYVHTDNSMYFVGDTLWYKAYVVRADNLKPTNLSRLLYVELLTPDGYLVERQHVIVSGTGSTCGQFVLQDSLYSGYYEIRAYTRWQLNFNATEKKSYRDDRLKFYGKESASDFFRDFDGLYSRVVPVYEKPKTAGDYVDRYMSKRPKQRVLKEHISLSASFYPEGGSMISGVPCNVAFEVKDNNGQNIDVEGTLSNGQKLIPTHMGKGVFTVTPSDQPLHASFKWNDKDYSFKLPAAAKSGVALSYDVEKRLATVKGVGVEPAAYAVLCRGKLVCFNRMNGNSQISLADEALPTGINELIIYDNNAQPVATRLFFVNNHDYGRTMDVKLTDADGQPVTRKTTLAPYSPINLTVSASEGDALPQTFSIAIRDTQTEDPGYDNGNIMTDMLLSSELKGFIAYPAYYFASDDEQHRKDLDILIMVQGWRKYKRAPSLRYLPETNLTYEGTVLKIPETATIQELEDLANVDTGSSTLFDEMNSQSVVTLEEETSSEEDNLGIDPNAADNEPEVTFADADDIRQGSGRLRKSVYVEAELSKEGDVAGAITATDSNGRFRINLPSFYDKAVLFVKAYTKGDSITKCMSSTKGDKDRLDERAFPDFFVKRDNFFPVFTKPYSWYQINSPDLMFVEEEDDEMIPENSRLAGNHTLNTVVVKARRRGKRAIDMTKPAIVRDLYDVFNELTDRGLSYGVANFNQLPDRICTYFFGNMGRSKQFNIRAMLEGTSFYRNYTPTNNEYDKLKTSTDMFNKLRLSRIKNVRLYTDYELRTDSGDVQESHSPDVTLVFELFEDGAKQYTYRDRRYIFDGITYAEECYSPDYSSAIPAEPTDYRRTLYWNPNAHPSADGTFTTKVYNNSRETRVTVSSAGIDSQGQMYYR